jgi:Putative viral replication protein./RNA helicase.
MCTIPHYGFTPFLPPSVAWIRGQLEQGEGGFLHWQLLLGFCSKKSLAQTRELLGPFHYELARSESAAEYVWKEDTRVEGTQFELGIRPFRRNVKTDWEDVWRCAVGGQLMAIEADIRIRSYHALRRICSDYSQPVGMDRECNVFYGNTGTGKSFRAWQDAGVEAYPKDPRSKFWCGYRGQEFVSLMNFVEVSTSHTCFDGSIAIQSR